MAVFLDGKAFGDDEMVVVSRVTLSGEKMLLGLVLTASENTAVCRKFLESLVERGMRSEQRLLFVPDKAKAFSTAVRSRFSWNAVIQRCRWHKPENVLKYLPDSRRGAMHRKI